MKIEIDQSGKIENTDRDTVIAFSNDISGNIMIKAKDKREIQKFFRRIGKSRVFIYKLFAILIFLAIKKHIKKIDQIIIDIEYPGWEHLIKDYLLSGIKRVKPNFDAKNISFKAIGKKSKAHLVAADVTHKKVKPDLEIKIKETLKYIIK